MGDRVDMREWTIIRVQKGVPIPVTKPRGPGGAKEPRYPWHKMNVGDSFEFPNGSERYAHAAAGQASRYSEKQFIVRKLNGRMRCWRIA